MADMPKIEPGLRVRSRGQSAVVEVTEIFYDSAHPEDISVVTSDDRGWARSTFWDVFEPVESVESEPEPTVAVPVSLLEGLVEDPSRPQAVADLIDLLPKPPAPRLVAVYDPGHDVHFTVEYLDAQPDLLDQINDVIDDWARMPILHSQSVGALKVAIRRKLTGDSGA